MFRYLPEQASDYAHKVDYANYVVTDISVFFTVAIVGTMLYFAVRYRRMYGVDHETPAIEGNNTLEILWTVIPTIVCIWVAYLGVESWDVIRTPPKDAMEVNITGRKWAWDFEYKNGKKTTAELVVPVDKAVKLNMTSTDVLHSFFIPAMRTKMDVVPGRQTYQWFRPIKTGTYQVYCTEYCGDEHSMMLAKVKVLPQNEFDRWLADDSEQRRQKGLPAAELGKELYVSKSCVTCHSLDGSPKIGPTWQKIFQREQVEFADGTQLKVGQRAEDQTAYSDYIKSSINNPGKQIVKGYPPNQMPSYQGQLSDPEMTALLEFMKTLDGTQKIEVPATQPAATAVDPNATPAQRGEAVFKDMSYACATCHSLDGSKLIGPSFKGLWNRKGKMVGGAEITADDAYIKESILKPQAKVVDGYAPAMPPFEGRLDDQQLNDIIEYIKTLQ